MRWNRDTDDDLAACKMKLETDLSNMKKAVEEVQQKYDNSKDDEDVQEISDSHEEKSESDYDEE